MSPLVSPEIAAEVLGKFDEIIDYAPGGTRELCDCRSFVEMGIASFDGDEVTYKGDLQVVFETMGLMPTGPFHALDSMQGAKVLPFDRPEQFDGYFGAAHATGYLADFMIKDASDLWAVRIDHHGLVAFITPNTPDERAEEAEN